MGEAKRKRAQASVVAGVAADIDAALAAAAVRQVVGALTDFHGADCLLLAGVTAGLLRELGVPAQVVAGSAAWRVGSGDSDVVSHAFEIKGSLYVPADAARAGMFHAWVEAPGVLADFSTCTLRLKAEQLDAADGGTTVVQWAPEYIWEAGGTPAGRVRTPREVLMAPLAGVYTYVRHESVEQVVLANKAEREAELKASIFAATQVYAGLRDGRQLRIIGVGEKGQLQEKPPTEGLRFKEIARDQDDLASS